jgi:hypothetical protein
VFWASFSVVYLRDGCNSLNSFRVCSRFIFIICENDVFGISEVSCDLVFY